MKIVISIHRPAQRVNRSRTSYRAPALLFSIIFVVGLSSCASHPVEELVTTDANRSSALPPGAAPVALAPDLPVRDENVEAAGDRIAEAITYLKTPRRDRREQALRALNQAEASINRALRARTSEDEVQTSLRAALKDLETAERTIQRGTSAALTTRQLAALNKSLDNLNIHQGEEKPVTEPEATSADEPQSP